MTESVAPYRDSSGRFTGVNPWTKRFHGPPPQAKRRYCIHGHPLFGNNMYRQKRSNAKHGEYYERVCLTCARDRQESFRQRRRERERKRKSQAV